MLEKFMKWTPKRVKKWEEIQKKGKKRFVWINGVSIFGSLMFVFMTIFNYLQDVGFNIHAIEEISFKTVLINFIVYLLAGYIFGLLMWSANEKSYKKHIENTKK